MTRYQMLAQAQRNLDLADLLVSNGEYQAAPTRPAGGGGP